jgi:hypothetical protein
MWLRFSISNIMLNSIHILIIGMLILSAKGGDKLKLPTNEWIPMYKNERYLVNWITGEVKGL